MVGEAMVDEGMVDEGAPVVAPASVGIEVHTVSKVFRPRKHAPVHALDRVDLHIRAGEFVTLIGPSGCGKSTLLRVIGGLTPADAGHVQIGGRTPQEARLAKDFGFVPQSPALLPWQTVRKNVVLLQRLNPRRATHRCASPAEVDDLLERVGLAAFADALPGQLSGGMQQRVALVRAFALGAPVLLMDEPFSALDEITRVDMRYLLLDLWQRIGTTVVFVTHSIPEAVTLSDRVVVLAPRPGRVRGIVDIDLPRPRHEAVEDSDAFHHHVAAVRHLLRTGMQR
jgi:NitT/TauT family transport system ATP-binding protein